MKNNFTSRLILISVILSLNACLFAQKTTYLGRKVETGVIRIKFTNNKSIMLKVESANKNKTIGSNATLKSAGQSIEIAGLKQLNKLNKSFNAVKMTRIFRPAGKYEQKHKEFGLDLWYEIKYNNSADLQEIIRSYSDLSYIQIANPKYSIIQNDSLPNETNDPSFAKQWHYKNTGQNSGTVDADINLEKAWTIETGNSNVIVAVEDGGIDGMHEDLIGNLWTNAGEIAGNGIDDDNNGYVDDVHGYNFADNKGTIVAQDHGTHVAGTIAAETNNGIGVSGIAGGTGNNDGVRLMSCQVFSNNNSDGFAEAFTYAADNGAVISQNSWGYTSSGSYDQSELDAIDYFITNAGGSNEAMNGGIVIVAAGNDDDNADYYPAYYSPTLAVSAVNNKDQKAYYSNYGTWVDIAAPGGEQSVESDPKGILSTIPGNKYDYYQGTSMACPHVSGVAALVVSYNYGNITASELRSILINNVDSIDDLNPTYAGKLGSGRLNAYKALTGKSSDDSGGDTEDTTTVSKYPVKLVITFDNYPSETSWDIKDASNTIIESGGTYASETKGSTKTISMELPAACYNFTIYDSYGDGISGSYGNGSYKLYQNDSLLISGGTFSTSETKSFCITVPSGISQFSTESISTYNNKLEGKLFEIYPNPASDYIIVKSLTDETPNYMITDISGKPVSIGMLSTGENKITLNNLPKGIYVIKLTIGKQVKTQKIIKK